MSYICLDFAHAPSPGDPNFNDFTRRNRWFFYLLNKTVKTNEGQTILDKYHSAADGCAAMPKIVVRTNAKAGKILLLIV